MTELNCVLVFQEKAGTITAYYPYTKWRNILDAPNVGAMESDLYGHIGNTDGHVTHRRSRDGGADQQLRHRDCRADRAYRERRHSHYRGGAFGMDRGRAESGTQANLFNNITGNPFLVSFDALDGITLVKGVWNVERQRIEC
jgi:hypothetical protein